MRIIIFLIFVDLRGKRTQRPKIRAKTIWGTVHMTTCRSYASLSSSSVYYDWSLNYNLCAAFEIDFLLVRDRKPYRPRGVTRTDIAVEIVYRLLRIYSFYTCIEHILHTHTRVRANIERSRLYYCKLSPS